MNLGVLKLRKDKLNQLNKKNINSIEDLICFFPRKYYDFTKTTLVKDIKDNNYYAIIGVVCKIETTYSYVKLIIKDAENKSMSILWFNNHEYISKCFKKGHKYIFCGKVKKSIEYNSISMIAPLLFSENIEKCKVIHSEYSQIQGMSKEYLSKLINMAFSFINKDDYLETSLIKKFQLMNKYEAYKTIHSPNSIGELKNAKRRIIFDSLFKFNMKLMQIQKVITNESCFKMKSCEKVKQFLGELPFDLTDGQKQVLKNIFIKMNKGVRLDALVQGDVSCGKTLVAIISMIYAFENGYQSVLMCPTTVLAKQHFSELLERTKNLNCSVAYLSGETKEKERRSIIKKIALGEIDILVGTHAVISEEIIFKNLALTIVDEEHRFGVVQRNSLIEKAKLGVHNITMSATPIPRSLALTVYGESKDILTIKALPKGRKPVNTISLNNELKTYEFIYNEIKQGRQCYVVCPLIEDSKSDALKNVDSVENTYTKMVKYFKKYPQVKIGMISGKKAGKKVKQEEITKEIDKFTKNEIQILISTTIIEVGVNVPNASVILIKNAERFGIAQLHQLRGRVGRGEYQSYCLLLSSQINNEKISIMCKTTDGFKIAEEDLRLRGPGDFIGTNQTGENKYVVLMLSYPNLNKKIKEEVLTIYNDKNKRAIYNFFDSMDV